MLALYRKELASFFSSWTAYLAIGLFLLLAGLIFWVFPDTAIPDQGYASLDYFFYLIPYLLLFLVPAISMGMFASERREGTLEWLQTKPLTDVSIVMAKFLSGLTIIFLTIIPTFIYIYSLGRLAIPEGHLDYGSIWGSYLGLMFLAATFMSISLAASVMTRQVMAAFLLAVFFCFLLYAGPALMSALWGEGQAAEMLQQAGMQTHFESLGRGVLDSRDLLYFLGVTFFFLFLTQRLLAIQRMVWPIIVVLISISALLYVTKHRFVRLDLTGDQRYSIAAITKESLLSSSEHVTATVLLGGDLPTALQRLKKESEDLLRELKSQADGRFTYRFVHLPDLPDPEQKEWIEALEARGAYPIHLSLHQSDGSLTQRLAFPYIWLNSGQDAQVVSMLHGQTTGSLSEQAVNQAVSQLEYGLVSAWRKLGQVRKPWIGITEGHGEADELALRDAIHALSLNYQVGMVDLEVIDQPTLEQLDVLAIVRPVSAFSESEKVKIDYHLMRGGKLILALDQLDGSLDSLRQSSDGTQTLWHRELHLDDLLFNYGLRFNADVLLDLNSMPIPMDVGSGHMELVPWPLHPLIVPDSRHPIVKDLPGILTEYMGSVDTVAVAGVQKEVVLHSSPYVRKIPAGTLLSLNLVQDLPPAEEFLSTRLPVAVLLEGSFPSAYRHRMLPDSVGSQFQSPKQSQPTRIFAIADGDVFINQINPQDQSAYPLGWDRFTEQPYGNKALLLNLMDYFLDDPALIALRQKEVRLRPIDALKWRREKTKWQLVNILVPLLLISAAGSAYLLSRRRQYGKS